jgi:hypothetical protein
LALRPAHARLPEYPSKLAEAEGGIAAVEKELTAARQRAVEAA